MLDVVLQSCQSSCQITSSHQVMQPLTPRFLFLSSVLSIRTNKPCQPCASMPRWSCWGRRAWVKPAWWRDMFTIAFSLDRIKTWVCEHTLLCFFFFFCYCWIHFVYGYTSHLRSRFTRTLHYGSIFTIHTHSSCQEFHAYHVTHTHTHDSFGYDSSFELYHKHPLDFRKCKGNVKILVTRNTREGTQALFGLG